MKILIVNDDSISAPGIEYLARAAAKFGQVWVVAPKEQCSAMSQKLTLRELLTLEKVEDFPAEVHAAYRVGGTPVDCVKVALDYIMDEQPDIVFSGINNGYNVGFDIAYSGTMGAAFEAARHGIPAIAFSAAGDKHLPATEPWLEPIISQLLEKPREPWTVWNVNFPAMNRVENPQIRWECPVTTVSLYREKYIAEEVRDGVTILRNEGIPTENDRIGAGTDGDTVRSGNIAISKVKCIY